MAANLKPAWETLMPAAALLGVGAAVLWTAEGAYLTACALHHARLSGMEDRTAAIGHFNGIFFGLFQINQLIGNLMASFLVKEKDDGPQTLLFTVFLILAAIACALLLLVKNVRLDGHADDVGAAAAAKARRETLAVGEASPLVDDVGEGDLIRKSNVFDVFRLHRDPRLLLLIPVIVYNGVSVAFSSGAFTRSCIKESLGTGWVGYVQAGNAGVNMLASFIAGRLSDRIGRAPVVVFGILCHAAFGVLCYITDWSIADQYTKLFVAAALFGAGDACYNTQIGAFLGTFWGDTNSEAAFAAFKAWQSAATAAIFVSGTGVSFTVSCIILFSTLGLGTISFVFLERLRRREVALKAASAKQGLLDGA